VGRDLQHLLDYAKWDNFLNVVSKAKTACEVSGLNVADHFADVGKMVDLGSGSQREVDDILTKRALQNPRLLAERYLGWRSKTAISRWFAPSPLTLSPKGARATSLPFAPPGQEAAGFLVLPSPQTGRGWPKAG